MGRGWRRAFCTTVPTERETEKRRNSNSSHSHAQKELGLFSSTSNPATPRLHTALRCRTFPDGHSQAQASSDPKLQCNTKSPRSVKFGSNPSSPRSPFTILKNTLRFSRNGCGVCLQSVKTGQGMAIYTAECGHAFHFPCIASHVRKQGSLICPVCNLTWKDVPLLSFHKNNPVDQDIVDKKPILTTTSGAGAVSAPATPTGTHRTHLNDKRIKCYNDDEPLPSPRFNTIPEESEDAEEFQGFFVNPPAVATKKAVDPYGLKEKKVERNVSVKLLPEVAVVSGGRAYETYAVALRVKAPQAVLCLQTHRAAVDLVTVLDVSGSMTGAKLLMLKRAMRLVISSLSSADRLAIVAFSSSPQRLLPLKRMTSQGQKVARKVIDNLTSGLGTCVGEALRKAAKVLEDRREKNPVASIMLLSDGHDEGVSGAGSNSNPRQGSSQGPSARFSHIEIPVHSSGYGFKTHVPAEDAFAKCVGGLLSVVVQDLRVQLGFASGSAPAEIMAVYSCNSRPSLLNPDSVRLGDLYAEEERELLIELRVPTSALGSHHVMSVRCSYRDPVSQGVMYGRERALLIPRPQAARSNEPRVERLRCGFIYTRAVAESRRLVEHGDLSSAHHLLASAKALLAQGWGLGEEYARELEAELAHLHWRRQVGSQAQGQGLVDESGEPLTPTSAWREAERLAKVAMVKKSLNRSVSDLHGFENARF